MINELFSLHGLSAEKQFTQAQEQKESKLLNSGKNLKTEGRRGGSSFLLHMKCGSFLNLLISKVKKETS